MTTPLLKTRFGRTILRERELLRNNPPTRPHFTFSRHVSGRGDFLLGGPSLFFRCLIWLEISDRSARVPFPSFVLFCNSARFFLLERNEDACVQPELQELESSIQHDNYPLARGDVPPHQWHSIRQTLFWEMALGTSSSFCCGEAFCSASCPGSLILKFLRRIQRKSPLPFTPRELAPPPMRSTRSPRWTGHGNEQAFQS